MKILFVSEQFPWPLDNGGAQRTHRVLEGLAGPHEVTLVAHEPTTDRDTGLAALEQLCEVVTVAELSVWRRLVQNVPRSSSHAHSLWLNKNASPTLLKRVLELCADQAYDAVHFNMLDTACFMLGREDRLPDKVIFDSHNCLSDLARQAAANERNQLKRFVLDREARALATIEQRIVERSTLTLVCSEDERDQFLAMASQACVKVVPNGATAQAPIEASPPAESRSLAFVGAMDYAPNVEGAQWFCQHVWPGLRAAESDARLYLVGRHPTRAVQALRELHGVEVTGTVNAVEPYLARASVVVVPLLSGSGTRLKIVSAMASGRPVVSTTIGAAGLGLVDGEHLLIADRPREFAEAIRRLWEDPDRASRIAASAREVFEERFTWNAIQLQLLECYDSLTAAVPMKT
ncbi:D-inositol-3-phosphate glycosyltransferase [Pseudobythopirellula maris]|uniref:D-inositol-3-phosphate glycosyltransferase n=1 Tax=Pseudobythopirellula maris TaxID=2527991 RepID=A0A5C5ZUA5_9BACT|nr:glycosyltransferase [Pseudobythopirellula maris]TWT89743.1 D-inositol-3-phosphate glycosyltransferase [Pseudobythopirellula maris]